MLGKMTILTVVWMVTASFAHAETCQMTGPGETTPVTVTLTNSGMSKQRNDSPNVGDMYSVETRLTSDLLLVHDISKSGTNWNALSIVEMKSNSIVQNLSLDPKEESAAVASGGAILLPFEYAGGSYTLKCTPFNPQTDMQ